MNDDFQDELISAYLDDELSAEDRSRVQQRLADDDEARRIVDELRTLRDDIRSLPRHQLESDFARRVLRSAEREMLTSRPGKEKAATGHRRGRNEHRRLSIRGLLWTGVAIACAVIIGIEFNGPDREPAGAVASRDESARPRAASGDTTTDGIGQRAVEANEPAATDRNSSEPEGLAASPDQDADSAAEEADSRKPKSKTSDFSASPPPGGTRDKAQVAGRGYLSKPFAGEAQRERAPATRNDLRRRLVRPDRKQARGTAKPSGSLSEGSPIYVVTVDLTSEATSQQAWLTTLRKFQVFDEDDKQEDDKQLGLAENEKLAVTGQVYSVSLPRSRADALITALQEQRDSFGVTVHASPLPELTKGEETLKKSEAQAGSLRKSASSPTESSKNHFKIDEAQRAKRKARLKSSRPAADAAKPTDNGDKRSAGKRQNKTPQNKTPLADDAKPPLAAADTPASRPPAAVPRQVGDPVSPLRKQRMRRWAFVDDKAASRRAGLAKRGTDTARKKTNDNAGVAAKGASPRRPQTKQRVMLFFVLRTTRSETAAAAESVQTEP